MGRLNLVNQPPVGDGRLSPERLVQDFGVASPRTRQSVHLLYRSLVGGTHPCLVAALHDWRYAVATGYDLDGAKITRALCRLAHIVSVPPEDLQTAELLFATQTYYALIVRALWAQFNRTVPVLGEPKQDVGHDDAPFSWCHALPDAAIQDVILDVERQVGRYDLSALIDGSPQARDLLKHLYESLVPQAVRHALGEYYTPDWLAEHVLDQAGYSGTPGSRLLDPACGSGTFLVAAIQRIRRRDRAPGGTVAEKRRLCQEILQSVVGFDVNPLAVLSAQVNYRMALGDLAAHAGAEEIPVFLRDSILDDAASSGPSAGPFAFVVGNPPWIAWDDLTQSARQATRPLWEKYGLFSLSGSEARHGGAKKDLSMLMLYTAADRYLADGGRLGMVITQTLFQTKGAGDGFRRFRLGAEGAFLRVLRVDDFVDVRPFATAANWTSTLVAEKASPTIYPLPYFRWRPVAGNKTCGEPVAYLAGPVDQRRPTSPWTLRPAGLQADLSRRSGQSDYQAHLGANSGGANGVFWVRILDRSEHGARIRNLSGTGRGNRGVEEVEATVEPDLLYPLLRWGDVARFRALPKAHLVLAQDPATRRGIAEEVLRSAQPRMYAYLKQFERVLACRAAFRRYQQRGPFYSMYDVDHYTLAPIKVVWRRMDRRIHAAVVEPYPDPLLGARPVVPQETCVLVACQTADEAHYLAALMNSAVVGFLVATHSVRGGKGFGTPGILDVLGLRRFNPQDERHMQLAVLSRQAHDLVGEGKSPSEPQQGIDDLSTHLWGIGQSDLEVMRRELDRNGPYRSGASDR